MNTYKILYRVSWYRCLPSSIETVVVKKEYFRSSLDHFFVLDLVSVLLVFSMRNLRNNLNAYNGKRATKGLDTGSTSNRHRHEPIHDSPLPSRKKLRKSSTVTNTNAVRKYSPYEPDLMTTTPKLIRKLLSKQFTCTREAAYAYIQSIQAVSLQSLVPSSPAAVSATSKLAPSQILLLGSCCWTGSEAAEAKAMLYEIIVSFTLNVGRRGWDNLSLKDFAENAVRNFVFAVQRVVQFIWLEPIRNHQQQQQYRRPYQQHTDRCTTTNPQREQLDQQLEQEYFHTFTTLVYQIYALTHESLAFLCSTLQQSVLVPHHSHNPQQQQQRCPLSSQVFTLPAHARPVVGQDGISLLIRRLEQELDIYLGGGEVDILPSTLSSSTFSSTFLATKHNASQRRIYGVIREAIIETNINDRNNSNRTKTFLTTTTSTSVEQQEEEYVFLQIVLGRLYPMEEKEKNGSSLVPNVAASCEDTKRFLVLYQPCSNLCVLATTGRRLPSKLVDITPKLLAAVSATICGDTPGRFFHTGGNREKAVNITTGK